MKAQKKSSGGVHIISLFGEMISVNVYWSRIQSREAGQWAHPPLNRGEKGTHHRVSRASLCQVLEKHPGLVPTSRLPGWETKCHWGLLGSPRGWCAFWVILGQVVGSAIFYWVHLTLFSISTKWYHMHRTKGVETTHCRSPRATLISNIITVTFSVPSHFGG